MMKHLVICPNFLMVTLIKCKITIEGLSNERFSQEIIDASLCITKRSNNEDYDLFISRVLTNPLASKVKINDLKDSMYITRLNKVMPKALERILKYQHAYNKLINYYF